MALALRSIRVGRAPGQAAPSLPPGRAHSDRPHRTTEMQHDAAMPTSNHGRPPEGGRGPSLSSTEIAA